MKKLLSLLFLTSAYAVLNTQTIYVQPSPTDASEELTLYIDMSQSTDGLQNNGLKAILTAHPEEQDSVYLWSWMPTEPVVGNGNWSGSNEALLLTHEGDLLYSITFIPTEFYAADGPEFFAEGISCLAKLKDGNAFADDAVGEAKSEDFHVDIIPKLCDDIFCIFPALAKSDDFISFTYDNNQETITGLQNMGPEDCYIYLSAVTNTNQPHAYVSSDLVTITPELNMKEVPGMPGFFRLTIVPDDFFEGLIPEGEYIDRVVYRIYRPGFNYPAIPPSWNYTFLNCQ
ncbi:MAG: hypothetical protein SH856_00090 [Flavobacteriales bacterium]|nr:hypothetical protein [Flavobacteriales bacterium]